jgi:hypothetical protein
VPKANHLTPSALRYSIGQHTQQLYASNKWLLSYIDGRRAPWKLVLDRWLNRTYIGKGAAFSTISIKALTQHISDNLARHGIKSHLPNFWVQALLDLKNIGLTELTLSREVALAQPLWYNPHFTIPPTATAYKAACEHLSGQILNDTSFGSSPFSKEQLESYLVPKHGVQWHRDQVNITIC